MKRMFEDDCVAAMRLTADGWDCEPIEELADRISRVGWYPLIFAAHEARKAMVDGCATPSTERNYQAAIRRLGNALDQVGWGPNYDVTHQPEEASR